MKIGGQRRYLLRAVDQDGDVLDNVVLKHFDKRVAKRFFCNFVKSSCYVPHRNLTNRLRSCDTTHKYVLTDVIRDSDKCHELVLSTGANPGPVRETHRPLSCRPTKYRQRIPGLPCTRIDTTAASYFSKPFPPFALPASGAVKIFQCVS